MRQIALTRYVCRNVFFLLVGCSVKYTFRLVPDQRADYFWHDVNLGQPPGYKFRIWLRIEGESRAGWEVRMRRGGKGGKLWVFARIGQNYYNQRNTKPLNFVNNTNFELSVILLTISLSHSLCLWKIIIPDVGAVCAEERRFTRLVLLSSCWANNGTT